MTPDLQSCRVCDGALWWRSCPTGGWWVHGEHPADGHDALPEVRVLVAVIICPRPSCGAEVEGTWAEPDDSDDDVEDALQTCGSCGEIWTAEWAGFSFRTEAG